MLGDGRQQAVPAEHAGVLGEGDRCFAQLGGDDDVEGLGEERQPLAAGAYVEDVVMAAGGDVVAGDHDLVPLLGQLIGERTVTEVEDAGQTVPDEPLGRAICGGIVHPHKATGRAWEGRYASGVSDPFIAAALLEGVPSAFAATRDGMDSILRDRGLRQSTPDDTARSLLMGAAATAALDGSAYDPDTLAAGGGDVIARAAVRLSTELLGLLPGVEPVAGPGDRPYARTGRGGLGGRRGSRPAGQIRPASPG